MSFFNDDTKKKMNPTTRSLADEFPHAQELINDALNTDTSQSSIRRRNLPWIICNLGSSENEEFVELSLDSTENDEQPVELSLDATEKDEPPVELSLDATEKDEQPVELSLDATEKDEQPTEDELKLNNAKLFLFDWTTTIYGFLVPLVTMKMGYENMGKCPANLYIPYTVIIIGLLSLLIAGYVCLITKSKNFYCLEQKERKTIKKFSVLLACVWILQCIQVFSMEVSFDSSAHNYCRHSFYNFNIVMNTFIVLAFNIGLGLWFYDPDFLNRASSETPELTYKMLPFESD